MKYVQLGASGEQVSKCAWAPFEPCFKQVIANPLRVVMLHPEGTRERSISCAIQSEMLRSGCGLHSA